MVEPFSAEKLRKSDVHNRLVKKIINEIVQESKADLNEICVTVESLLVGVGMICFPGDTAEQRNIIDNIAIEAKKRSNVVVRKS